jgi:ankyrin repeat protein
MYKCSRITECGGFTPLHIELRYRENWTKSQYINYEFDLINFMSDLNSQNEQLWTPLMLAARNGYEKMVAKLISAGAKLDLQDINGWTALQNSCRSCNTDSTINIVKMLIDAGANLDLSQKEYNFNALMLSCALSNTDSDETTVQMLIDAGANLELKANNGYTPLLISLKNIKHNKSTENTVKMLIAAGAQLPEIKKYDSIILRVQQKIINENKKELIENKKELTNIRMILTEIQNYIENDLEHRPPNVGGKYYEMSKINYENISKK